MLKYVDTKITFSEVPNEISLCINFSNCPHKCEGCHSSYLSKDIGEELNCSVLQKLIEDNRGISCICFMGGDAESISYWAHWIKNNYPNLKVAWYTGDDELTEYTKIKYFNYVKIGHYDKDKGPLNSKTTNQRFYEVLRVNKLEEKYVLNDITYLFWNK